MHIELVDRKAKNSRHSTSPSPTPNPPHSLKGADDFEPILEVHFAKLELERSELW